MRQQPGSEIRVAAIQMVSGMDVTANLDAAGRLIAQAARAGARLVVLPENFALMPADERARLAIVESDGGGPLQDFLATQAQVHGVWLVGGTIPLAGAAAGKLRSACLVLDDRGERVARYDKIHLFDVSLDNGEQYRESQVFEHGESPAVLETPFGRVGLAICYDLRFPELFRHLLDQGAELFIIPSAFTAQTGQAHWEVLVRARAIENLAYVIAANQGGRHENGRATFGDSMVVDPWGRIIARLAQGEGCVLAELNRGQLQQVRKGLPSIHHRRI